MDKRKLFIPYDIAIIAKENGFDEECFAWTYVGNKDNNYIVISEIGKYDSDSYKQRLAGKKELLQIPMYQQVIDWFLYKHDLSISHTRVDGLYHWTIVNSDETIGLFSDNKFNTPYEALNEAISESFKLIS